MSATKTRLEKLERMAQKLESPIRLDMPNGKIEAIPGGAKLLKVLLFAMRTHYAQLESIDPPIPPTENYFPTMDLVRQAVAVREQGGPGVGELLHSLLVHRWSDQPDINHHLVNEGQ